MSSIPLLNYPSLLPLPPMLVAIPDISYTGQLSADFCGSVYGGYQDIVKMVTKGFTRLSLHTDKVPWLE